MFTRSKKSVLGLDLSNRSFKIVQFRERTGKPSLVSSVKQDIPAGLVENSEIKKEKELIILIKSALAKMKGESLRTRQVVCNLPEEKVFIRVVQLPLMKKEEINHAVKWEAEAHIPLGLDEVYLDWQIIESNTAHSDHFDILIAVAPRTLIESYFNFLKKCGLQPIALEPESIAVVRGLIGDKQAKPAIIVDIGATGTNFVIFAASAIRFTSHVNISGQLFNQAIAKSLGVTEKEANQLKIKIGLDKTKERGKVYQALKPIVVNLTKQIADYINFYHNNATHIHDSKGSIAQVILCGGDSLLNNLPELLSQQLELPVQLGNPLNNLTLADKKTSLSKKEALSYTTAIGLALREFK